jgi:hypothetical protein
MPAPRGCVNRVNGLAFTNTFQFYPWMLDKQFEEMILINPAQIHAHLLDEFKGQSFPEQPQASIMWNDIDVPLARELLNRWIERFSGNPVTWKDKALFRSLNMANEAGRIPALAASVFYDTGRSLAFGLVPMKSWRIQEAPANPISAPSPRFWKASNGRIKSLPPQRI